MAWLYDLSFSFFVIVTGAAVLASGVSLVLPALFSSSNSADPNVNWNVIAIVGSYVTIVWLFIDVQYACSLTDNASGRRIFGHISQSENYYHPEAKEHPTESGRQ